MDGRISTFGEMYDLLLEDRNHVMRSSYLLFDFVCDGVSTAESCVLGSSSGLPTVMAPPFARAVWTADGLLNAWTNRHPWLVAAKARRGTNNVIVMVSGLALEVVVVVVRSRCGAVVQSGLLSKLRQN